MPIHDRTSGNIRTSGVPYSLRNGLEDALAVNTRMQLLLEQALMVCEAATRESEIQAELLGRIRNGEYDKEEPGAVRKTKKW